MDEYDYLDNYNGENTHCVWVNFDHYENTNEPEYFMGNYIDDFINFLNDWD